MSSDDACVALLQWALPRLGRRWAGYRKVRGQVCKRIRRRIAELGLDGFVREGQQGPAKPDNNCFDAYRERLEVDDGEWAVLDGLCGVTISRFYRDRGVWESLRTEVIPALCDRAVAAGERELRCWSVGCASGEEPYTLAIAWELELAARAPGLGLRVLASDVDLGMLERARRAEYDVGSLRELPQEWREQAFAPRSETFRLRDEFRRAVVYEQRDVRGELPDESFHLILCRNLVFTYFDGPTQQSLLGDLISRLVEGGALVLGGHEQLPDSDRLEPWRPLIFRRSAHQSAH